MNRFTRDTMLYVAQDGSYGDATDLLLVDATDFTSEDYEALDAVDDGYRREEAAEIGTYRMAEPLRWAWMTEAEAAQMLDSLEAAVRILTDAGQIGIAEQIGDVRDVFNRSGIHA